MDSPADYIAHVNKIRERISLVARKLKQPPLSTDFDPFNQQEEALKVTLARNLQRLLPQNRLMFIPGKLLFMFVCSQDIREVLSSLKTEVDRVDQKRNRILRKVQGEARENVVKAVERLKLEWESANTNHTDRAK